MDLATTLSSIGSILAAMAVLSLVEAIVPLCARGRWSRAHLVPNLALTGVALAANLVVNALLLALLVRVESAGIGLLHVVALAPVPAAFVAVAALDLSFYVAHVSWHKVPAFWRFHSVHHSDPALDVTTTIRQHPLETVMRGAVLAAAIVAIGPSAAAFAVYRTAAAIVGLLEHANLRAPRWLDSTLALVTTWPHYHKLHHSRVREETDSNYGNLFSVWDRLFGTMTPSHRGTSVAFGLERLDRVELQTTAALLAHPFRTPDRVPPLPATGGARG